MLSRAVSACLAAVVWTGAAAAQPLAPGVVGLDGRPVNPLSVPSGTRAHVLVFTTTDCPISNRYSPEITRLASGYATREVRFWVVYPVPGDTPEKIRTHATQFGLDLPIARDTRFEMVRHTGVTVTPEVAVIDARGEVAYRGRVDDRYVDFGVDRPVPSRGFKTTPKSAKSFRAGARGSPPA